MVQSIEKLASSGVGIDLSKSSYHLYRVDEKG